MNRKGKLTTKGKHALILALTIAACVTAMLFSLLLSVLCDGKYVSSAAHAGDISHPANVMFLHKGKATRVGFKMDGDKKVRYAKSTGDVID